MLGDFYQGFLPKLTATAGLDRARFNADRLLGKDPATGREVTARLGKFGSLVQLGGQGEEAPKFAGLRADQSLETITLAEALQLFALPRTVGTFEGEPLAVNTGRYGPYVKHLAKYYSLDKGEDLFQVDEARAVEIIQAKRLAEAQKHIKTFEGEPAWQILNGRWGPYIKAGSKNVRIPKDVEDPSALTLAQCQALVEAAPLARRKRPASKRK